MDTARSVAPPSAPAPGAWLPYDQARGAVLGGPSAAPTAPTAPTTTTAHELATLVASRYPAIALETDEEDRALALLDDVGYTLRLPVFDWTMTRGLVKRGGQDPMYRTADPAAALAGILEMRTEAIYVLRDLRGSLAQAGVARALRDVLAEFRDSSRRATIVILGSEPDFPAALREDIITYPLGLPTDAEYQATLAHVTSALTLQRAADVALSPIDQLEVIAALRGLTLTQARQVLQQAAAADDRRLDLADLPRIADLKARALSAGGVLEYFPVDDAIADLGGFARLRGWLDRARVGFSAEAKALNLPAPKGVLLTGVQGCGKSLAAKVIARTWQMPLIKLDAGRLYDKYVGESERNLRRALRVAESLQPAVLWIDEIEKALAQGSGDSTDGGLSQRILGTLLTWMSERDEGVFLVATANDIFGLPPELLRKGRFDELFFVDLPTAPERGAILDIHLRMRRQDAAALDLPQIVAATEGFSGAELEQIVVGALLGSLHARTPADTAAYVREAAATVPLSRSRAEDIARLRQLATGRFVPVGG